jgi:hypothetical protein
MKDKFSLTREQSIFLAKKKWDENIYCGMKMENRNVTFPETQTILNGTNVGSVKLDDIQAILNMRDAWRFLISNIDDELNVDFLCTLNGFISRNESLEWGVLRTGAVGISGTSYSPPLPDGAQAEKALAGLLAQECSITEKALDVFLWAVRAQLFWDGNKRTSLLAANALLVSHGKGLLTITEPDILQFNTLLSAYYETAASDALKTFLYKNAVNGIEMR